MTFPAILLLLYILNLTVTFGAGIYEMRIVIPLWFSKNASGYSVNALIMRQTDPGRKFWAFVTTIPLTLLTIANIWVAWRWSGPAQQWWLAAAGIELIERIGTFSFFIPNWIKLQQSDTVPLSNESDKIILWRRMNYLRNAITLLVLLLAIKAWLMLPVR